MKKIAILVDQLYQHGGIEKLVAVKANYWESQFNYDVSILSTENKNKPLIYHLNSKVKFLDLKINYNRLKSYFSFYNLVWLFLNCIKIQKYILKEKPDFIIVASHIPITYILPFFIKGKTKIVKEFHFTKYFYEKKNKGLKLKMLNYIESKYSNIVVLSSEEKTFYKSSNVVVIPNPVFSKYKGKLMPLKDKELKASTVLRFAPVKRLELLVSIWQKFSALNPNWKLFIYGPINNSYAKEIINLVTSKKLNDCIIFKGETTNVLEELSNSRLVLMTSEQECFPMLILEAQSVGVPVMAFNCPTGPRNIINNFKDGILVENNNIDQYVNSLVEFCDNEAIQIETAKNALINAAKFELDFIMDLWNTKIFKN